jgi:hypothetical protein
MLNRNVSLLVVSGVSIDFFKESLVDAEKENSLSLQSCDQCDNNNNCNCDSKAEIILSIYVCFLFV